jgi:HEAT repeat protein
MKMFALDTRTATAEALGKMANPQIVERLLVVLREGDKEERQTAAKALGYCGELALEGVLGVVQNRGQENQSGAIKVLERRSSSQTA